eukprot:CAMPEP_0194101222 /NCGR_PEP_ID=MMETSP0150-20130528/1948_1 /TAXON_ID=122233 /ORGANISM="Chaetoceros debilis, Strain MM31A-1" /LENGTH=46 /DNA_ID= /DNA_START= /DNA_END= /DNA_ORIENTATION=
MKASADWEINSSILSSSASISINGSSSSSKVGEECGGPVPDNLRNI